MATTDLTCFTEGEDRFGENVARTLRLLARLLLDWTNASDGPPGTHTSYLHAIYFDKLAELFCRLWNRLNSFGNVRYPTSLVKRRGFHGPGRAMRIDRARDADIGIDPEDHRDHKWAFTTEIVEKLGTAAGGGMNLFVISGKPWKHNCKISSGLVASQWDAWLQELEMDAESVFLTPIEVKYFECISRMICGLSADELRVLGTHCNANETVVDITFNMRSWDAQFNVVSELLERAGRDPSTQGLDGDRAAYVLVTTAREVMRKARANRPIYEDALKHARKNCESHDLRDTIDRLQMSSCDLWDDNRVQRFSGAAQTVLDLSVYIRRGLNELGLLPTLTGREASESIEAAKRLVRPIPNVAFDLPQYDHIAFGGSANWATQLRTCKQTIWKLLPPIIDYTPYGVPT